jgi:hypothetical protein
MDNSTVLKNDKNMLDSFSRRGSEAQLASTCNAAFRNG